MKLKKLKKILLFPLTFLSLLIIYYLILIRGYIPYSFQEKYIKLIYNNYFNGIRLEKFFGEPLPRIKVVMNYPNKLYFCSNDNIVNNKSFPKEGFLRVALSRGKIFDDDYNLLYSSGCFSFLEELENLNQSSFISRYEYFSNVKTDSLKEKLENMIILKLGYTYEYNFGEIYLKIYNDGEFLFCYNWIDEESWNRYERDNKNKLKIKIPISKELVKQIINQVDFGFFDKKRTFNSYSNIFGTGSSEIAIAAKKGEKLKVLYRGPTIENLENDLREFWAGIIKLGEIKKYIAEEIDKEDQIFVEEWRLEHINDWLSDFR